ncbi:MAG: hypothetical protein KAY11_10005 [Ilumatobacteraceae bacterium]|jgi:hypothetical protein|nr:hypothetical protein [Ilumatobacteraceae bacterium]
MTIMDARRVPPAFAGPAINAGLDSIAWSGASIPPLHLNGTATLLASQMDGLRSIDKIAEAAVARLPGCTLSLAEMQILVHRLGVALSEFGLLQDDFCGAAPRPDATAVQQPNVCEQRLYRLNGAALFLVDVGYRTIVLSVADHNLARELAVVLDPFLIEGRPVDLSVAPLELAVVPAEQVGRRVGVGFHHLHGPDNRTLVRSTDLGDVVSAVLAYVGNELAVAREPDAAWFRGTALQRRSHEAFVVSPGLFRVWKSNWRRIEAAGYAACPGINIRVSDDASSFAAPRVEIDDGGLVRRCSEASLVGPRQAVATENEWTSVIGLAVQNEGGTHILDPMSEAAFEFVHQAFQIHRVADERRVLANSEAHTLRVLDAAWALSRRAGIHRSARLDHEFIEAVCVTEPTEAVR